MLRQVIHIDEEKCNGCGLCAKACHEGAIAIVNGKAKLMRDDFCDGMGDCLPNCPTGAITFEQREAAAYNEAAVKAHKLMQAARSANNGGAGTAPVHAGCPGSAIRTMQRSSQAKNNDEALIDDAASCLTNWPIQIKLASVSAPYFNGADLLIAADCTAYAYASFHKRFIDGRVTLIGCPKLDAVDYSEKLTNILTINDIRSVTVVRMIVPCCGGLENAVRKALAQSQKAIPLQVVTIGIDGDIVAE